MLDTLYERIGGTKKINSGLEVFYREVLADDRLCPFFGGVDMEHLRARQSMFLSMLLGGKKVYSGKKLRVAHAGARMHGMDDSHFDALLQHFRGALTAVGVAADPVTEIMTLLEGTRNDVLDRS